MGANLIFVSLFIAELSRFPKLFVHSEIGNLSEVPILLTKFVPHTLFHMTFTTD